MLHVTCIIVFLNLNLRSSCKANLILVLVFAAGPEGATVMCSAYWTPF